LIALASPVAFNVIDQVGPDLRAGRFYSEVVSSARAILTVRSEIGPYGRPIGLRREFLSRTFRFARNDTGELTDGFATHIRLFDRDFG
jgi:hypothetical protein